MISDELYEQMRLAFHRFLHERYLPDSDVTDLTPAEGRFVEMLLRAGEKGELVRPSKMAEFAHVSPSALSQITKSLEAKGVVERSHRGDDCRAVFLSLTAKGERYAQLEREDHKRHFQDLLNYLGEEDTTSLVRILGKISDYNAELAAEGKATRMPAPPFPVDPCDPLSTKEDDALDA